jgi:hypothetical protein
LISKDDGKGDYLTGTSNTYTVTVLNNGPSTVTGAILKDPFCGRVAENTSNVLGHARSMQRCPDDSGSGIWRGFLRCRHSRPGQFFQIHDRSDRDRDFRHAYQMPPAFTPPDGDHQQRRELAWTGGNPVITRSFSDPTCTSTDSDSPLPTITKGFSPLAIQSGGTSVLTFNIDNTIAGAIARSGMAFTDLLPSSLQLANGTVGGTCGGYTVTDAANAALAAGVDLGEGDRAVDCGGCDVHDHGQRDQQAGNDEPELCAVAGRVYQQRNGDAHVGDHRADQRHPAELPGRGDTADVDQGLQPDVNPDWAKRRC